MIFYVEMTRPTLYRWKLLFSRYSACGVMPRWVATWNRTLPRSFSPWSTTWSKSKPSVNCRSKTSSSKGFLLLFHQRFVWKNSRNVLKPSTTTSLVPLPPSWSLIEGSALEEKTSYKFAETFTTISLWTMSWWSGCWPDRMRFFI